MKRDIAISIVLFYLVSSTYAQQVNKFDLGLVVSPEINWGVPSNSNTTIEGTSGPEFGFIAGIEAAYHINEDWSLRTGALFSKRNYRYEISGIYFSSGQGMVSEVYDDLHLLCIKVPVKIVYNFSRKWNIAAGINFTQNFSKVREREVVNPAGEENVLNNSGTGIHPSLISIIFGVGKSIEWENSAFEIQPYLEYTYHEIEHVILSSSSNQLNIGLELSFWFSGNYH